MGSDCLKSNSSKHQPDDISSKKRQSVQYLNQNNKIEEIAEKQHIKSRQSLKKGQDIKLNVSNKQSEIIIKSDIEANLLQVQKFEEENKDLSLNNIQLTKQTRNSPTTDIQLFHIEESQYSAIQGQGQIKQHFSYKLRQNKLKPISSELSGTNKSKLDQQKIQIQVSNSQDEEQKQNKNKMQEKDDDDDDIFKAAGVGVQDGSMVIKWSGIKKLSSSETKLQKKNSQNFLRSSQLQLKDEDFSQEEGNMTLMEQDQLDGTIIQQQHFSTIKVYNSKIMFEAVLPKRQAGPIIVPFLDYSEYCL